MSNSALGVLEGVYRPAVPITCPNVSPTGSWESSTSTLCLLISRAGGTKTFWAAAARNPSAIPLKRFATCWDKFSEMKASESARFCRWGNFCHDRVSAAGPMADSGCSDHKCWPYLPAVWNSKWQNWQRMVISKSVSNWGPVESPHHRVCQCCQSHRSYYSYCVGIPLAYPQPLAGICDNWCIGNTMRHLEGPSVLTNESSLYTLVVWVRALYWSLHNDKVSVGE